MVKDTQNGVATSTGSGNSGGIINSQDDNKPAGAAADWSPWPNLQTDASVSILDTDGDGMPDCWEDANGLDKNNKEDGNLTDAEGYTNLERYMNSLVADIMVKENEGGRLLSGNQTYEDAAGIADAAVCDKMADGRIYNLQGMAVSNPARGGIYIRDGKKFIKL